MAETILFISLFLIFFAYFGYPITLALANVLFGKPVKRAEYLPTVTFIITVHNEEKRVAEKLDNVLRLDYPPERLEVLVASDGSVDATNNIVQSYADRGVKLLEIPDRGGKENAQKYAVARAGGEIIVFSDVATGMEVGGLRALTSNFADPTVGCVSSEDRVVGRDGKPSGEGLYIKYEMWLRALESKVNSLVGLSGSLFAARKEVCQDFSADMQSDFRTVLSSMKRGLRGISDANSIGIYQDAADPKREWDRKIRTVIRGLTVFFRHAELLNPFRFGFFSYQLFCHKLLRWSVPMFLVLAFFSNLVLAKAGQGYASLLALQSVFYALGVAGLLRTQLQEIIVIKIAAFFLTVNASLAVAWLRYLQGDRIVKWAPTQR